MKPFNMPKVTFKLDIKKDARNYCSAANSKNKWGHDFTKALKPEILEKLKDKKFEEVNDYLLDLLEKVYSKDNLQDKLKEIEKSWRKIEEKYFKKLAKITKHPIYTEDFTCYATTIDKCPYNNKENWFMLNIFSGEKHYSTTIAHELMHLQFHYYFEKDLMKDLSKERFQDFKEALTVLLNLEFKDILSAEDKGYPNHKELREFIEQEWEKHKDFDILIKEGVNYLKKN